MCTFVRAEEVEAIITTIILSKKKVKNKKKKMGGKQIIRPKIVGSATLFAYLSASGICSE